MGSGLRPENLSSSQVLPQADESNLKSLLLRQMPQPYSKDCVISLTSVRQHNTNAVLRNGGLPAITWSVTFNPRAEHTERCRPRHVSKRGRITSSCPVPHFLLDNRSGQLMDATNRYLHFNSIDLKNPYVRACCNQCGQDFSSELRSGERMEELLQRIRSQFDEHKCEPR